MDNGPFSYQNGGKVGHILQNFDWNACSLGHFSKWSPQLQSAGK